MLPDTKIKKIVDIGDTLHSCGCPPYKVEMYTADYAEKHGLGVTVQATPTTINYQFEDAQRTVLMCRLPPPSINLSLLVYTIQRTLGVADKEEGAYKDYSHSVMALANISIPPAFLMLVGSTYAAVMVAALLGFLMWICQRVFRDRGVIAMEFFGALVTGLAVSALSLTGWPLPIWGLCIAAVLLFVPGLTIANALECLAFNDLLSGTSLLGLCIVKLIKIFVGIFIGLQIGQSLWGISEAIVYQNELPTALRILGLPLLSISLSVMFQARIIDMFYGMPVAVLGMWGPAYLGFGSGWVVGTWVTTVLITLYGTWIAKRLNLAGIIYITQGIIILVPGSRVLIGASQSLFDESILPIPGVGMSAVFMFSAIVAGQITAYALYSPDRPLANSNSEL
jgi:uncharacterized membrane protein YjjP (DUF1212 family)